MARKVWLEAALNGPWGRGRRPGIPITIDEVIADGVACAEAGAAVIHVHAHDVNTGRQNDDVATFRAIIAGIRARADVIVYPSIPFIGDRDAQAALDVAKRFAAIAQLGASGCLEWAAIDPGTTHVAAYADLARGAEASIHLNPEAHIRYGLSLAARHRFHPGYAIYEPGFLRLGAALARAVPNVPQAVYRFLFSDDFAVGFPPRRWALEAYCSLLAEAAPGAPWMIAGLGADILPLVPLAVAAGGHVRVGLEDAPFTERRANVQLVATARDVIRAAGCTLATARDIRADLLSGERRVA